ncbi:MAG: hypothetical protein SGI92_32910 [Bryobacteraceae bacterium]|nr:hypothetical protein [Bryobacteraceae bacterium]
MKLGAEPKKLAFLGGLLAVALAVYLYNAGSGSDVPPAASQQPQTAAPAPGLIPSGPTSTAATSKSGKGRTAAEFRPRLGRPRGNTEAVDPMSIDPTLKVELIARLQDVTVTGTHRSLFDFSQAAPPKAEPPKPGAAKAKVLSPIVPIGAVTPVEAAKVEPAKPAAPPIPMKFYGYVNPRGGVDVQKRAFFMEGEEIHIVREGDIVKRRYKIVRIGVNSAVVEDTNFPGSAQTLPLEEQPG